ncbi:SCO7613 C-terminal domain-containing membrane protein [Catelliglobosispora koreensis]|uniref:SCO7613 C-terminal domain-containing membrane protein n=1 Tax=Catelliglobosispora koreensis TaxID=129052 RepID=UPI00037B5C53|nr:hypothetical protein [Catelliglobosispora koreensis]
MSGGVTVACSQCGTQRDPSERCPKCGNTPADLAAEIIRVNRSITDMKQEDVRLASEMKKNSQKLQAALHQKYLLTAEERERQKKAAAPPKQRPWARKPTWSTQESPPETPRVPPQNRGTQTRPRVAPLPEAEPEASPRLVQNVQLFLGPLLLAITAVIFALFVEGISIGARLLVLGLVTAGLLIAAPLVLRRGLSSTAEALGIVGLALVPITGFVLTKFDVFEASRTADTTIAGLIFAATAVIAFLFHHGTALATARFAMVIAIQPVLPLLFWGHVTTNGGWAMVLTLVAAQNAAIARALELYRPPTTDRTQHWLWELTWILHGLAIGSAAVYALAALLRSGDVASSARAALIVLLVAVVGLFGALMLRRRPLGDFAAGVLTIAVIGSAARVAFQAIPHQALLIIAVVVFATGLAVRSLPTVSRRGPQLASAAALAILTAFVVAEAIRAALTPISIALPMWRADLSTWDARLAAQGSDWQLVATVALLAAAAALALPPAFRRECAVAGAVLAGLVAPVSLGLSWQVTLIVLTLLAIAMLASGLGVGAGPFNWAAGTNSSATAHLIATVLAGTAALGVALATSWSTAGVLAAFTVAGIALARLPQQGPEATVRLRDTAVGAAAFAAPGAVCTGLMTIVPGISAPAALTAGFLAASTTLALVAVRLVAHRRIGTPLAVGTGLGALVITGAAFGVQEAEALDAGVGALLLVAAILLALAPSIDEGRRADRLLDGADVASAAVTTALIASLARGAELAAPHLWLVLAAVAVLGVAAAIHTLPLEWRRGPGVGAGVAGAAVGIIAGYPALGAGIQAITNPGAPPAGTLFGWQAPAALVLLAIAAMLALPRPRNYDAAAAAIVLATMGTPAALGWPSWSSIVLGLAVSAIYAVLSTIAVDARAGYARLTVAIVVGLHALVASLTLWPAVAGALAMIAVISIAVAVISATVVRTTLAEGGLPPAHLDVTGGTGVLGALLAGPAAVAVYTWNNGTEPDTVYTITIVAIGAGIAVVSLWRQQLAGYLSWATVGVAISGTLVAVAALLYGRPAGVYAAATALLVVTAELVRGGVRHLASERRARDRFPIAPRRWRTIDGVERSRWQSHPGSLTAACAAAAGLIAIGSLGPALNAALVTPHDTLNAVWQGPPTALPYVGDPSEVITALLLTIAAALAAIGFGGGTTRAVSVVVPGIALTILITPVSLGFGWPASVMAGLTVFTVCMLSIALTLPPSQDDADGGVRAARVVVFLIGLIGGGAGLAGALATPELTIFTFAGAVGVGLTAAMLGRVERSRIMGWLFGAVSAELLVLSVSLHVGAAPEWAAFAVLIVGTALIAAAALLPRFTRPESVREASAMEWAGYLSGVIALTLAVRSPGHVAALLAGFAAVLGMSATRPGRSAQQRRMLFWAAGGSMIAAWWLLLRQAAIDLNYIELYTVPFALLALGVGLIELKQRPQLGSWAAYGPALISGFGPTIVVSLATEPPPERVIGLLIAGVLVLIWGSKRQQRAPVTIGAIVTTITAFHALTLVGTTWLAVGIAGVVLVILGASSERRRRAMDRYNKFR